MAASAEFLAYLTEMLEPLGPVAARRMFGGAGVFLDGLMFGLVVDDVLYLKTDDQNRGAFADAGMGPFRYQRAGREVALGYYEVPPDALEDPDDLADWARGAWAAARRGGAKPAAGGRRKSKA
ncbi:MAG: TfoX/Sxy family protein [Hyphomicrobiales bacterium]|nr:TfoX/Sxy family protein [Hyphomicrobiales bacterium]